MVSTQCQGGTGFGLKDTQSLRCLTSKECHGACACYTCLLQVCKLKAIKGFPEFLKF
jgi:hypothetical protein